METLGYATSVVLCVIGTIWFPRLTLAVVLFAVGWPWLAGFAFVVWLAAMMET